MEKRYMVYSIGFGEEVLRVEREVMVYEIKCENGDMVVLKCNLNKKEMEIEQESIQHPNTHETVIEKNTIIDLNDNGERWEGDSLFGRPFGYGKVFDVNNDLQYYGYMFEGRRVCFGETYFSNGEVEYSGTIINGLRHGKGKCYDKYGSLIFEGNWHCGDRSCKLTIPSNCNDNRIFTDNVEELIIEDSCYCDLRRLHFTNNNILERLVIGSECFAKVNELEISYCSKLYSIVIGEMSFICIEDTDEESGRLLINNCERLEKIEIGDGSFANYHNKFEILSITWKYNMK